MLWGVGCALCMGRVGQQSGVRCFAQFVLFRVALPGTSLHQTSAGSLHRTSPHHTRPLSLHDHPRRRRAAGAGRDDSGVQRELVRLHHPLRQRAGRRLLWLRIHVASRGLSAIACALCVLRAWACQALQSLYAV
jgi:hypothetical protein